MREVTCVGLPAEVEVELRQLARSWGDDFRRMEYEPINRSRRRGEERDPEGVETRATRLSALSTD
jgi:hypothetical protein